MQLRSTLGRVRGTGSAKEGMHHWWAQRMTALALVPLTVWLVAGIIGHAGAGHAAVKAWLSGPFNATLMVLTLVATFHHAQLGLQVVIEDYVHHEGAKIASIAAVKGVCLLLGLAAVIAVLKLAIAG